MDATLSWVFDVFKRFLRIDVTDRSKIGRDKVRIKIYVSLYTAFYFSRTLPLMHRTNE